MTNSEVKHKNGADLKSYVPERDPTGTFFFSENCKYGSEEIVNRSNLTTKPNLSTLFTDTDLIHDTRQSIRVAPRASIAPTSVIPQISSELVVFYFFLYSCLNLSSTMAPRFGTPSAIPTSSAISGLHNAPLFSASASTELASMASTPPCSP